MGSSIDNFVIDIECDTNRDVQPSYFLPSSSDYFFTQSIESEQQMLKMLDALIRKRKNIGEELTLKLNNSILDCSKKILRIGDEYALATSHDLQKQASLWESKMMDFELAKVTEKRDLFRDTLIIRNEWMKTWINYIEMRKMGKNI